MTTGKSTILQIDGPVAFFDLNGLIDALTEGRIEGHWLLFGLIAQLMIIGCLVAQRHSIKKFGRVVIRPSVVYVALSATVMLLVYASRRHDLVYVIGQILNVVIGVRILDLVRRTEQQQTEAERSAFPNIKPESAERAGPRGNDRSEP